MAYSNEVVSFLNRQRNGWYNIQCNTILKQQEEALKEEIAEIEASIEKIVTDIGINACSKEELKEKSEAHHSEIQALINKFLRLKKENTEYFDSWMNVQTKIFNARAKNILDLEGINNFQEAEINKLAGKLAGKYQQLEKIQDTLNSLDKKPKSDPVEEAIEIYENFKNKI